ncbi:hypothetical protein Vid5_gp93 [Pantoea phage vB_PagS_Vid5]|uniref:Peptidase C39 domain-containing protein n=1 Tax=Pantoea phage vB_PagS_Vid5 TaxID=2099652 RepID=A0A2P1CKZ0_9CAUD|nr:hypothetical protein FDJ45_gp062 [Pantoea phage vB_PagS_Vid5]AVJ51848.1 hypothetical protein Vid5_gp93 [Pantoea phage vB_PagS_Vid5]
MITHVQQKTINSCVSACLAMLSGKDFDVIYDTFHESYMANVSGRSISSALRQFGIDFRVLTSEENMDLLHGKLYLATVPSCNGVATFHQVIIDCTGVRPVVLDPAKGTEFGSRGESRYYVWQKHSIDLEGQYKENEYPLFSWILDYEITPKEVQP